MTSISGLIALIVLLIVAGIYQKQKIPFFFRKPDMIADRGKERGIIVIEWSALMLYILIFSPQCSLRHLVLLIPFHLLMAIFLLYSRADVKAWPLWISIGLFQGAKLADDLVFHPLAIEWSYFGGTCWCLLIALPLIIYTGLAFCRDKSKYSVLSDVESEASLLKQLEPKIV